MFGCHGQVQILQGAGAFCSLVVFYPDAFEIFHKSNYKRLLTLMSKEMIYETASNTNTRNSCDLFIFTLFFFECFPCFIMKLCQVYQKVAINLRAGGEYLNLLTQIIAKYSQQKKVLSKINSQREVKNK